MNKTLSLIGFLALATLSAAVHAESLAGRTFNRTVGQAFSFDPPNQDFAGITFNPLSQTYYVTDNQTDKLFEIQQSGALIRQIDISGLKRTGIATTDAEGVAWVRGTTYALALHDGKEIAVVNIVSTTTALARAEAKIFDVSSGPGKPKGLAYAGWEDAFYWVTKDAPKAVIKCRLNLTTGQLTSLSTINLDNLSASDLADVVLFPRLSPNLLFISESTRTVMEVDLTGGVGVVKSVFSTVAWPIPKAGGLLFNQNGEMVIVGKHASGVPEDDFNVFAPTAPISNRRPNARIVFASSP